MGGQAGRCALARTGLARPGHPPRVHNTVCRMVSFTYGTGWPALWSHANLDEATHDWVRGEFAEVPFTFFAQMHRSIRAGHLVPVAPPRRAPPRRTSRSRPRPTHVSSSSRARTTSASCRRASSGPSSSSPGTGPGGTPCTVPRLRPPGRFLGRNAARDTYPVHPRGAGEMTTAPSGALLPLVRGADVGRPVRDPAATASPGRPHAPASTASTSACRSTPSRHRP